MTTVTIQRNVLLQMITSQIATLEVSDKAYREFHGRELPLTTYMKKLYDDVKTAGLVVPVTDDIIQDYESGCTIEDRQDKMIDEIEATGVKITEELFNHVHDKP